jgi:hypothetical protein
VLADLAQALDLEPYALIITEQRCFPGKKRKLLEGDDGDSDTSSSTQASVITRSVISGIVKRIDLLDYISNDARVGSDATEKE